MRKSELEQLLKDMSLEEKIGQLLQLTGNYVTEEAILTGPELDIGVTEEDKRNVGSILSIYGAKKLKKIQESQVKKQPHHIPLLFMLDVIHGFKTVFPAPLALGCTFEPENIKKAMAMSAKESAVSGVHITFSPMSDLCRDARWGRVIESTGEDKYLNGIYAKAMVEGYQGKDLKDKYSVGACVKHFAAYGYPEAGRDYNTVELSKRTLFEDYLPAYEEGVKAGACMVMTSFNTLDRVPSTANRYLMRDLLRERMGFNGVLISDFGAVAELINHGVARDRKEAAKLAIKAGVDIEMMTRCYPLHLKELIEQGEISEELLDEAVMRMLTLKNDLGLFENPYKDASEEEEKRVILCKEHKEMARNIAESSFVLLENDGILPLRDGQKIAVIGPYADRKDLHGAWALMADEQDAKSVKEVLEERNDHNTYLFESAFNVVEKDSLQPGLASALVTRYTTEEEKQALVHAKKFAKEADVAVLLLGEHRLQTSEAASVADIRIPRKQMELLEEITKVNSNVVVVLFNGRPLDLREIKEKANAIVEAWFPGTCGAEAVADTLFGENNPSGRLSMSFPYSVGQCPVHYDGLMTGRPKENDEVKEKFCSRYEDIPNAPLYPFGYGLSYSKFTYGTIHLSKRELSNDKGDFIYASVEVTNTSDVAGEEVVQLYIRDVNGSVARPCKELKGFVKLRINPNETKTVTFCITKPMLAFYDINMEYTSEPGAFYVFIGHDSSTDKYEEFILV